MARLATREGSPSILHQWRLRWGLPPGHLPQACRSQWEPPKGSNFSGRPRSSPPQLYRARRTPGLALARTSLHLRQGGQRLKGKPAGPSELHSRTVKSTFFKWGSPGWAS